VSQLERASLTGTVRARRKRPSPGEGT